MLKQHKTPAFLLKSLSLSPLLAGCAVLSLLAASCACSDNRKPSVHKKEGEIADAAPALATRLNKKTITAIAYLNPVSDTDVRGKVEFKTTPEGVQIVADIEGLTPGQHGFHIHEHGSCGGKEASEAGSHFNPTHHEHAGPDSENRHVGDLGNLVADENGYAHYERIDRVLELEGERSIIGRSLIIHADKDDYTTQPAGASGAKISCGIIEAVSISIKK